MPKLLLFAPCEKVIINQNDNTTSLICLLEALNIAVPESEVALIPEDANIPLSWHLIALWQAQPEDAGKHLEQRFALILPSGEESTLGGAMSIAFEPDKPNFRNVLNVLGFPLKHLLKTDHCSVAVFIKEQGDDHPWQRAADFPIIVRHGTPKT